MTAAEIIDRFHARIARGVCGDCGEAPLDTACTCLPCYHRHYCRGRACICPRPSDLQAYRAEQNANLYAIRRNGTGLP